MDNLRRKAVGEIGGPRDVRFAKNVVNLISLLETLGSKSELLDDTMLNSYQHRVDNLTQQIELTFRAEGISKLTAVSNG